MVFLFPKVLLGINKKTAMRETEELDALLFSFS